MPRALWWFRWSAVVTVLAGLAYWGQIVATDARNGGAAPTMVWPASSDLDRDWGILYAYLSRQGTARQRLGAGRSTRMIVADPRTGF